MRTATVQPIPIAVPENAFFVNAPSESGRIRTRLALPSKSQPGHFPPPACSHHAADPNGHPWPTLRPCLPLAALSVLGLLLIRQSPQGLLLSKTPLRAYITVKGPHRCFPTGIPAHNTIHARRRQSISSRRALSIAVARGIPVAFVRTLPTL